MAGCAAALRFLSCGSKQKRKRRKPTGSAPSRANDADRQSPLVANAAASNQSAPTNLFTTSAKNPLNGATASGHRSAGRERAASGVVAPAHSIAPPAQANSNGGALLKNQNAQNSNNNANTYSTVLANQLNSSSTGSVFSSRSTAAASEEKEALQRVVSNTVPNSSARLNSSADQRNNNSNVRVFSVSGPATSNQLLSPATGRPLHKEPISTNSSLGSGARSVNHSPNEKIETNLPLSSKENASEQRSVAGGSGVATAATQRSLSPSAQHDSRLVSPASATVFPRKGSLGATQVTLPPHPATAAGAGPPSPRSRSKSHARPSIVRTHSQSIAFSTSSHSRYPRIPNAQREKESAVLTVSSPSAKPLHQHTNSATVPSRASYAARRGSHPSIARSLLSIKDRDIVREREHRDGDHSPVAHSRVMSQGHLLYEYENNEKDTAHLRESEDNSNTLNAVNLANSAPLNYRANPATPATAANSSAAAVNAVNARLRDAAANANDAIGAPSAINLIHSGRSSNSSTGGGGSSSSSSAHSNANAKPAANFSAKLSPLPALNAQSRTHPFHYAASLNAPVSPPTRPQSLSAAAASPVYSRSRSPVAATRTQAALLDSSSGPAVSDDSAHPPLPHHVDQPLDADAESDAEAAAADNARREPSQSQSRSHSNAVYIDFHARVEAEMQRQESPHQPAADDNKLTEAELADL